MSAVMAVRTGGLQPPSAKHQSAEERPISVLIADRDPMSAGLLATALKRFRAIQVIGSTTNRSEISAFLARRSPHVLVISSVLEDGQGSGFRVMRELREGASGVKLVALLDSSARENVVEAFWSGAHGVFVRSSPVKDLGKCISCVHKGQIWGNTEQMRLVLESLTRVAMPPLMKNDAMRLLTPREQNVLGCLSKGLSNREIARQLGISQHTVKNYLLHIFDKLGVSSRVEALLQSYGANGAQGASDATARPGPEDNALKFAANRVREFYRRETKQEFTPAQLGLHGFDENSEAGVSDAISAYVWHELTRKTSDKLSEASREERDKLAATMTPEEIAEAKRLVEEWSGWVDSVSLHEKARRLDEGQEPLGRRMAV